MPPAPTSTDLAGQLAAYNAKPVTSTDALNSALTQYGVPEIRNTVSGLRTTLANTQNAYNNVDPSVTGRTQGSLVTEAQRAKQVTNEEAPIAQNLTAEGNQLTTANADLTDKQNQASQLAQNQVSDYNAGRAALQNEYDTTYKSEQDKAATALAQQQAQEQQRQFNVSQAASTAAANTKASTVAPAAQKQADMAQTSVNLNSKKGSDNHVSQETWNKALDDWTNEGYSAAEFVKNNIKYINQRYKGYSGFN